MGRLSRVAALSSVMVLVAGVIVASVWAAPPDEGSTPAIDFSGTYVDTAHPVSCSAATMGNVGRHHASPALHIDQVSDVLVMRMLPPPARRVLHIRRGGVARASARPSRLAAWDGAHLVVESPAPASPLWGPLAAVDAGSKLTERFSLEPGGFLVYRTWYTPPGASEALGPFEVRLAKCRS
jgi:hypothetical protein